MDTQTKKETSGFCSKRSIFQSMTSDPASEIVLQKSILIGATMYLIGLAVVVFTHQFGWYPEAGLWSRGSLSVGMYLLIHWGAHLPIWGGTIQIGMLGHTAGIIILHVCAGYLLTAARNPVSDKCVDIGRSIVAGYFPSTVLACLVVLHRVEEVSWIELLAPALLVGVAFPLVFGGVGGWLYKYRTAEQ